ncbi:MAG: ABC transporter permease [Gammaproteobacteria bacterium]|nr:ABC transporter permease [Gammaproteobacteria bacterium]
MVRKSPYTTGFLTYLIGHIQALKISLSQLKKSSLSTFITCMVIGISLALPVGMMVLLKNVRVATAGLKNTNQISIYLKTDISDKQRNDLLTLLNKDQSIHKTTYVSPEEGLKAFQDPLGLDKELLADLKENPLPGVVVVEPEPSLKDFLQINQLATRLKELPQVDQVQIDMAWLQRLNAILILIHRFIFAIMLLFALGVLLIISHTIQLITENYRDEIMIIKLLGASNSFIKRPFLYSGLLYGLIGGFIGWFLIFLIIGFLRGPIEQLALLYNSDFQLQGLNLHLSLLLLAFGGLLGYLGSWLSVCRHIKAIEP